MAPVNTDPEFVALREAIDSIDSKILQLIADRVRIVLRVGEYKRQRGIDAYDPERERTLLDRLAQEAPEPLEGETVRRIFERLVDESRRMEARHMQRSG
jgi:chorismate mutase